MVLKHELVFFCWGGGRVQLPHLQLEQKLNPSPNSSSFYHASLHFHSITSNYISLLQPFSSHFLREKKRKKNLSNQTLLILLSIHTKWRFQVVIVLYNSLAPVSSWLCCLQISYLTFPLCDNTFLPKS